MRSLDLNPHPPAIHYPHLKGITPTARAARALQIPHKSLEALALETINRQGLIMASPLRIYRCLKQAIRSILNPQDLEGITRYYTASIQTLLRLGISLEALSQVNSNRIQTLAKITLSYQQSLRQQGLIDPAELLWKAAQCPVNRQPILFYGYFQPREDEWVWMNAIAGDGSILSLPYQDHPLFALNRRAIDFFTQQGWQILDPDESSPEGLGTQIQHYFLSEYFNASSLHSHSLPPNVKLQIYSHLEAEVRGVLSQVKQLLHDGVAVNQIVLTTRDERAYGSLLLDIAWEYQLPLRIFYGIPLIETRLGSWIHLLFESIQNHFAFESTLKLVNHPLSPKLPASFWAKIRQTPPQTAQDWRNLGIQIDEFHFPQKDRRDNWVQRLQTLLKMIQPQAKPWAREIIAFYKLQTALVDLSRPETERLTQYEFIQEVLETLAQVTVPIQPGRGGVELHNPLLLQGARYQYVFVLGAMEGILNPTLEFDPLLAFQERKQLSQQGFPIETAVEIVQKETLSFYGLLQIVTEQLIFSYPQLWKGTSTLVSSYITPLKLQPSPLPSLPLSSLEETRKFYLQRFPYPEIDLLVPQIIQAWEIETQRENATPPNEYDGVIGLSLNPETRVFSASQLMALGQCPFKWFASRILGLEELPEAELELKPSIRGRLYHRCLELVLKSIPSPSDLLTLPIETLEVAFSQAEQELNVSGFNNWHLRRSEHLELLHQVVTEPNFLPAEAEVLALETPFQIQWYGLNLRGVIDRIDSREGGLTLIDYKTSSRVPPGVKDETGKAKLDIQLSIYRAAIAKLYPEETVVNAIYYSLTKRQTISQSEPDPTTLTHFINQVYSNLQQGNYPVQPDIEKKACLYCSFDLVCRQGTRLNRKFTAASDAIEYISL